MRMQSSGSPDERHCCSRADETQMLAQAHETEFAFVADNSPSRNLVLPCPKASKVSKMARPSRKAGATVSWKFIANGRTILQSFLQLYAADATHMGAEVAKALPSCVAASVARVVDETQSELRSTTGRADAKPRRAASRVNANPATPGSLRRPPVRGGGPAQGRRLPYLTQSGMVGGAEPSAWPPSAAQRCAKQQGERSLAIVPMLSPQGSRS